MKFKEINEEEYLFLVLKYGDPLTTSYLQHNFRTNLRLPFRLILVEENDNDTYYVIIEHAYGPKGVKHELENEFIISTENLGHQLFTYSGKTFFLCPYLKKFYRVEVTFRERSDPKDNP